MLGLFVAAFLVLGLTIFVFSVLKREDGPESITAADSEDRMKAAVVRDFYDPGSAEFRSIEKSTIGYCGEVNAKNRIGGYVGFEKFHATSPAPKFGLSDWLVVYDTPQIDIFCKH